MWTVPSLLPPDAVCVDIGANIGCFSCFVMRKRPDVSVFAFEPRPDIFRELKDNVATFRQCVAINAAVSSDAAELTITLDPSHGRSTVVESAATAGLKKARVPAVSLDTFIEERHLQRLDFLKIDVEGYEWEVLKGANASIKKFMPIIMCEIEDRHLTYRNIRKENLFSWLKEEVGYEVFLFDHGRFVPYGDHNQQGRDEVDGRRIFNWILVHNTRVHLLSDRESNDSRP